MTFDQLFEKYMKNSSVNRHQAEFIWNAAIDEVNKNAKYEDFSDLKQTIKIKEYTLNDNRD